MDDVKTKRFAVRAELPISANVVSRLFLLLDSVTIVGPGLLLYFPLTGGLTTSDEYLAAISFIWLSSIMLFHFTGLYRFEAVIRPFAGVDKIIIALMTSFLFLLATAFALKVSTTFSRGWMISFALASCSATLISRLTASFVLKKLTDKRLFSRKIVIAGRGEQARRLIAYLSSVQPRFVSIVGFFTDKSEEISCRQGIPVLGTMDQFPAYARSHKIDDVVIALPWSAEEELIELIGRLRELPINIYLSSDLIGFHVPYRLPPSHFNGLPFVEVMGRPLSGWDVLTKTLEDYLLGLVSTILLLPFFGLIALAIKIDSPGPILFRQKRLGFNNRVFSIYKFRTMYYQPLETEQFVQARRNDSRVTPLGRFLRRTSLDELPQLFNVISGSMSLVGPRPHPIDLNEHFAKQIRGYFARHRVKPGITGWAQVKGFRGETSTPDQMESRVAHDIYYTENWSLLFDLQILARTVVMCVIGKNAY